MKITDVFKLHPECYDAETRALLRSHNSPFDFDDLTYVEDVEGSKDIVRRPEPSIVIAASGMCEAGRVLHHLRNNCEDPRNTILIVGFQAQHTLGRRIVERRPRIRILGVERDLRAQVRVMNAFSAHADKDDLRAYAHACGTAARFALVHGEPESQEALQATLRADGFRVDMPTEGTVIEV